MWNRIRKVINEVARGMIYGNIVISNGGGVRVEEAL